MSIPYEAATNYSLPEPKDGECVQCRGEIDKENEETFFKAAGYGFNFTVSSATSGLCRKCFNELRRTSEPDREYSLPSVKRVGKYTTADGNEHEIFEEDYLSMDNKKVVQR